MRSPSRKTTIITFVVVLLLLSLSLVSAELNKRDPQAPQAPGGGGTGGGAAPAPANPAGGTPAPGGTGTGGGAAPAPANPAGGTPAPAPGNPAPATPGGGTPTTGGILPTSSGNSTSGNSTSTNSTSSTQPTRSVDPTTPPVQVVMREPIAKKNLLYKIGKNVTFKWNYTTDFADPPASVIAMAQPSINPQSYITIATVGLNKTMQEVVWNTAINQSSIPMTSYKLFICDERGLLAPPKPGGLQIYSGSLSFVLYTPEPEFCAACSSAISISAIPLLSTIGLTLITIISFCFIYLN